MQKCVFLDRDGVLNEEIGSYAYNEDTFKIIENVPEALQQLKKAGFLLIVVTNQAGIAKGVYTRNEVRKCHNLLQQSCGHVIDDLYFSPHHEEYDTASLLKKPDSLMLEKAIAKYNIDISQSWMVGDSPRDITAGKRVGLKTIVIKHNQQESKADYWASSLLEAYTIIT